MTGAARHRFDGYTVGEWEVLDPAPDGSRVELINGALQVTPPPAYAHQTFADRLCRIIDDALWRGGRRDLLAVTAVGVRVTERNGFIPDVAVVYRQPDGTTSVEAADTVLAVEVVSPRTVKQDRMVKPAVYGAAGVAFYWRVEPCKGSPPTVFCCELVDGAYVERCVVAPGVPAVITAAPVPISLDVDEVYSRIF